MLSLFALMLMIQFGIGLYRLKWGIGMFLFIFVVLPSNIPFLDFFDLNVVRVSILVAFFNILIYHKTRKKIMFVSKFKYYFFPILIFSLLILPSYAFAEYSDGGFRGLYLYFTYFFVEQYLPGILLLWVIKDEFDLYYYIKWLSFSVLFMGLYGLYEFYADRNPFMDWMRTVNTGVLIEYSDESRFGFSRRVQSTSWHPIAYGGYLSMYVILFFAFIIRGSSIREFKRSKIYLYGVILLALVNIILTASRAPWLCTILTIALIIVYNIKYFMRRYFVLKAMFLILIAPGAIYAIVQILTYISTADVNGSSLSQRFDQFNFISGQLGSALYIGFGPDSINTFFKTGQFENALGFESIIFVYLVKFGILGLIALIVIYSTAFRNIRKRKKNYYTSFFGLILISHLIFVLLSGEIGTFRYFWLLYSMIYAASGISLTKKFKKKSQFLEKQKLVMDCIPEDVQISDHYIQKI